MNENDTNRFDRIIPPLAVGISASLLLAAITIGILTLAENLNRAVIVFWQERLYTMPILVGFGLQAALFVIVRRQVRDQRTGGKMRKAVLPTNGTVSTMAMVACCAHHLTDAAPFLGLSVVSTFLVKYQTPFMTFALVMNGIGIGIMLRKTLKLRELSKRTAQASLGEMETVR